MAGKPQRRPCVAIVKRKRHPLRQPLRDADKLVALKGAQLAVRHLRARQNAPFPKLKQVARADKLIKSYVELPPAARLVWARWRPQKKPANPYAPPQAWVFLKHAKEWPMPPVVTDGHRKRKVMAVRHYYAHMRWLVV